MTLRKKLASIAAAEIGVREVGGNNRGPKVVEYQSATWLKPAPWPWCAAFVCWVIKKWALTDDTRTLLSLTNDRDFEKWRPKTASAFDFANWAKERDIPILGRSARALAGDLAIFDFSHIGVVIRDQSKGSTQIVTVEGNTNNKGERDSNSGDGVWRKIRPTRLVRSYIRITEL
jgi:hypothetical protein